MDFEWVYPHEIDNFQFSTLSSIPFIARGQGKYCTRVPDIRVEDAF